MPAKMTFETLANRVNALHPHLTLTSATTLDKPATAHCSKHGVFDLPRALVLLKPTSSGGCPGCATEAKGAAKRTMSYARFVSEARKVHGDRYTYPKQEVPSVRAVVQYLCPEHGTVSQVAGTHLRGAQCCACSREARRGANNAKNSLGFSGFIAKAREIHGDRYTYPEQLYRNGSSMMEVVCDRHGKFAQRASDHLAGSGCQQCYAESKVLGFEAFVANARRVHGDRYDYPEQSFEGSKSYVTVICKQHGAFQQLANTHTNGCGCPDCVDSSLTSKAEDEIASWLESLGERVVRNSRRVIKPLEVDLWLPERNLAIEHDGLYWHSEAVKPNNYHAKKQGLADAAGVRLLQVLEDEWIDHREKVKAIILLALGRAERLHARKLRLQPVSAPKARAFYDLHHLQGFSGGTHAGLYREGELVACATLGRSRFGRGLELIRYATAGCAVVGGLARLMRALTSPGDVVTSYCDRRWFTGQAYKAAGFKYEGTSAPGYSWVKGSRRLSRHKFQKRRISEVVPGADLRMTEVEIAQAAGYLRLFDAGHLRFVYTRT